MKRRGERRIWGMATAAAVGLVLCLCVLHEPLWSVLGVNGMRPYFADWYAILAASDARAAGADPFAVPNSYDPFGRPHIYGPWWLELWRLGLTRDDNGWMGVTLVLATVVACVGWLRPSGPGTALLALSLLISPAFMLGYERGNNDLVVLLLLLGAGGLLARTAARREAWVGGWVTGVLGLAAALKFYPVAALPMLAERVPMRRAIRLGGALGVAGALGVWFYKVEIARALGGVPALSTGHGFGLRVLGFFWSNPSVSQTFLNLGILSGVAAGVWLIVKERRAPIPLGWRAGGFAAGAWSWVFCYLAGFSFAYRAVLLVLPAGVWLHALVRGPRASRGAAGLALGSLLVMVWLTTLYGWMNSGLSSTGVRAASYLLGLQNGLALGLTAYLGRVAAVRLVRAWRRRTGPEAGAAR